MDHAMTAGLASMPPSITTITSNWAISLFMTKTIGLRFRVYKTEVGYGVCHFLNAAVPGGVRNKRMFATGPTAIRLSLRGWIAGKTICSSLRFVLVSL